MEGSRRHLHDALKQATAGPLVGVGVPIGSKKKVQSGIRADVRLYVMDLMSHFCNVLYAICARLVKVHESASER